MVAETYDDKPIQPMGGALTEEDNQVVVAYRKLGGILASNKDDDA